MSELKSFYDKQFEGEYREKVAGYEVARWFALAHFIPNVAGIGNARKVLDYGAGSGLYVELWQKVFPDAELHFCDISSVAFEKFKTKYPEHSSRFHLLSTDSPPMEDNSFDAIVSVEVIEHVEDVGGYVDDILRLLKPGGCFVWTTPCANPFSIEHIYNVLTNQIEPTPDGYRRWKWEGPAHLRRFKSVELKRILIEHGFELVDFRFRSHFFSFICSKFPRRFKRVGEQLMKLDYGLFRRMPNGASMLGCARRPQ